MNYCISEFRKYFATPCAQLEYLSFSRLIVLVLMLVVLGPAPQAASFLVKDQNEYWQASKQLKPGDFIVLANGIWRDFEIVLEAYGTADQPITLMVEEKGKVIISGKSNLKIAGEHLLVKGLVFKDGYTPTSEVISFRRSKTKLANHSRVTETVIDHFNNPERFETDFWVMLYGKHNRFDHNHLEGKSNKGVTMAVRLNTESSQQNYHRIDHNYFGPRPVLGSNGGETLRIGTSHYAETDSYTLVENNYFDRCNGEVEIISSKSGANIIRGNVFFESRGTLTLRHGDGNLVEENLFFGNGKAHTGGIRVINRRQTIRNNYLHGLTGYRFGSALTVMNGVPDSPANRYVQVENALIENNTIINSEHIHLAAGSDRERSAVPINSQFKNNLIYHKSDKNIFSIFDDVSGIRFDGNVLNTKIGSSIANGFVKRSIELKQMANGLLYPIDATLQQVGIKKNITPLEKDQTGVDWYQKAGPDEHFGFGERIEIEPGADTLTLVLKQAQAGDEILLKPGDYTVSKVLHIDRAISIRTSDQTQTSQKAKIEFERTTLFEITEGGSLQLADLELSGKSAPDSAGNSLIRTSRYAMLNNYQLIVKGCVVSDLDINHSFNFFTAAKHTFADTIRIVDSSFNNISGDVLKLNFESDDLGIYNAEYITIRNAGFENIGGAVANVYRGGTDESTFGPQLTLHQSSLNKVGLGKRNKSRAALRLHGVQVVNVQDNQFSSSMPVRVMNTVGEPVVNISDNRYQNTEQPSISQFRSNADQQCVYQGRGRLQQTLFAHLTIPAA